MAVTLNVYVGLSAWTSATYTTGDLRSSGGNAYVCVIGGSSTGAPTGTGTNINNGGVATWNFISTVDFTDIQAAYDSIPSTPSQAYFVDVVVASGSITTSPGTSVLNASGKTTTSTNSITVRAKPGYSFRDKLLANGALALAYNAANGSAIMLPSTGAGGINYINVADNFITLDGFQIQDPLATSNSTVIATSATTIIQNCIIDGFSQAGGADILQGSLTGDTSSVLTVRNCLIIDRGTSGASFPKTFITNYNAVLANNTIIFAGTFVANQAGVQNNGGAGSLLTFTNNILFGYASTGTNLFADAGGTINAVTNVTDVASFSGGGVTTGAGNLFLKTAANQFTNATTNFRLKTGADAINAGTTDTTDVPSATDILGRSRPQGSAWDIGAYEAPAAAAVGSAAGVGTATGVGRAAARATGTAAGVGTATGLSPTGGIRTVTAAGVGTALGVATATSVGTGTAAGAASVTGFSVVGAIASTIDINPIPPQSALQSFPVSGSFTLIPQLQFAADSSSAFTPIPASGITPITAATFEFTHPGAALGTHLIQVTDPITGAASVENFLVDAIGGRAAAFPPTGITSLTRIIPSYLYWEYSDDDDLQALVAAYNATAQGYLDGLNSLNLPIYTGLAGPLLDWVGEGVYGLPRPTIAISNFQGIGPFNTWPTNTLAFNLTSAVGNTTIFAVTDELYKRIITWHFYKGDGFQFNIRWLKRRVARFLAGVAGTAPNLGDTSQISVKFPALHQATISIAQGEIDTTYAAVFQAAVTAGTLPLPFQIAFTVLTS